jgi:hypothetical protein
MNKLLSAVPALLALAALAAVASCKSNITNLREQVRPTYHDIIVETGENTAYTAALSALTRMGYTITSSGAAQKRIEAISAISAAGVNRPARQLTASVRIGVAPDNCSNIQILFTEISEEMGSRREGMGTRQPLADSPLYNVFAKYVNETLSDKK